MSDGDSAGTFRLPAFGRALAALGFAWEVFFGFRGRSELLEEEVDSEKELLF